MIINNLFTRPIFESQMDPITQFASNAHEEWRRNFDPTGTKPRVKKNSDGTEGDINVPFEKLHSDWKKENLAAGHAAHGAVKMFGKDMEKAAEYVHNKWMQRNPKAEYNAAQHVPYDDLPEDEKEKDRVHVRTMMRLMGQPPEQNVAEGSAANDYFTRRKSEEERIAGTRPPAKNKNKNNPADTDYSKRRAREKKVDQGVAEGSLEELANTSLKVKEPKGMYNVNDRKQVTYKVMKFKSGKDTYLINFTVKGAPTFGKKQNWNAVNVAFGVKEKQDDYSFGDEINTDLTARNKNQFLIYSTVINAVRKFITEYNTEIDEIIMQGAGERQEAMYQRFFQSAGKYFPGWHYNGKHSLVRDVSRHKIANLKEQGVAEGKRNLKCVCKTHGKDQCPVHAPIDEGAKSDNKNKKEKIITSSILKGLELNEVNPNNYDSDWDYQDAVARSGRSRSRSSDSYDAHDAENDAYEMHKRFAATRARKEAEAKAAAKKLDELSPQTLASYKKKAGADATTSDKASNFKQGNKRMSGIMQATKKEFANDAKGVAEGEVVPLGKKHHGDLDRVHSCPKCGGDLMGGNYMGQRVKVCQPCKQVYLPPNSGIDQQGNKIKEQGVAEGFLNEGLSHPVIVVDVQPEYSGMNDGDESSVFPQIINFVNKQTGPVLMFVNAEDQGLSGDTIQDIKQYWDDTICPEEERYTHDEETDDYIENPNCPKINWQRFAIADKGYGYFRSWMDHGIEPATIVATIRELYQQKKSDSRELQFPAFNKRTPQQSLIMGAMQEMEDDPISVNWTSVSQLKRFNGAYIVGGARDLCLREVELLMNAFNIKYKRIDSLIYEGQQGVAEGNTLMKKLQQALLQEGRVKELADDLKTLNDVEFMKKYGKAKAEIRKDMRKVAEGSEYKSRHAHKQEQDKAYNDYRTKHATSRMALMTRAEFAKYQREKAAKNKQGVEEARMSAAQRLSMAWDKQRAKSDASLRRTPSSIPKSTPEPKKLDTEPKTVSESRVKRRALMAQMLNSH